MIVGVSFADVLGIKEFSTLQQFDLLPYQMDSSVLPYLFHLGCDIDKSYIVQACKHYTMGKDRIIGYRYVFSERTDKEWMNSSRASMSARINSQKDKYLAADMVRMSAEGLGMSPYKIATMRAAMKINMRDIDPEYVESVSQIQALQWIQTMKRGNLLPDEDVLFDIAEEEIEDDQEIH